MYALLAREAEAAGLPLNWPPRLPNSRLALAAAEWIRRNRPDSFPDLSRRLFEAHFAKGEDLGDPATIDLHLAFLGIPAEAFWAAIEDGSAARALSESEEAARRNGVRGTPAWLIGGRLLNGLRPAAKFEQLAGELQQAAL